MSLILILACSAEKRDVEKCPAGELYTGSMFLHGKSIANKCGIPYWILSAKYGIVTPDEVVDNYNQKLTSPYKGPFPPNPYHGFYVGGQSYFKNFPDSFLPLVEIQAMGWMLQNLRYFSYNINAAKRRITEHPRYAAL